MDADVIKQYLIGLGFSVDRSAFGKLQNFLGAADSKIKGSTASWGMAFAQLGAGIVSTFGSIIGATTTLLDKTAQADLGYQKFAMRMYMARDAAKQFKIVTDAMGENPSDLAWNPELNERYKWLMGEASKLQAALPPDAEEQFRKIRDIRGEFTLMKIEMNYGLQSLAVSIAKHFNLPLQDGKSALRSLNEYIQEKIPQWADTTASAMKTVYDITSPVFRLMGDLGGAIGNVWDQLSTTGKVVVGLGAPMALFATLGLGSLVTKFGLLGLAIGGVLLLLEDFYAYTDGRKNSGLFPTLKGALAEVTNRITGIAMYYQKHGTLAGIFGDNKKEYDKMVEDARKVNDVLLLGKGGAKAGGLSADAAQGLAGIGQFESGGKYNKVGPWTTNKQGLAGQGLGKYQIMSYNWPEWVKEARKAGIQVGDDWRDPKNQEAVAQFKWLQYVNKYGSNDLAAAAWHGGEGAAQAMKRGDYAYLRNTTDVNNTSIQDYIRKTQGRSYYPNQQSFAGGATSNPATASEGPTTFNFYGVTPDQMIDQVKDVMRQNQRNQTIAGVRYAGGAVP